MHASWLTPLSFQTVLSIDDRDVVEEIETFSASSVDLDGFLSELGLLFELRSWLLEISMKCQVTIDRIRESLQQSVRSQCITRLSFKSCSKAELNGLLFSAQRLYCYCGQQGLGCTQHYIRPVIWLATGGVYIEKALTSVLDDVCTLLFLRKKYKVCISVEGSMTGVNLDRNVLVSSKWSIDFGNVKRLEFIELESVDYCCEAVPTLELLFQFIRPDFWCLCSKLGFSFQLIPIFVIRV